MEIKLINKNKDSSQMSLLFKGVNAGFINTLRRVVLESVPTLAIEDIVFKKNDSILYDEVVANRLGLVPIVTDLKSYVLPELCDCQGEGCAQCSVQFSIEKVGPGTVYSGDLKFVDPSIKSVYDNIPIVKLTEGQELIAEGKAVLGKGIEHVKWSPGHCFHRNVPEIKITGDVKDPEAIVDKCPGDIFKVKSGKLVVNDDNLVNYNLAYLNDELGDEIKISLKEDEFVFEIETWKQLQVKEILTQAFKEMDFMIDDFSAHIKEL